AARVRKRAHHVEQRVRVAELLGLEALALALGDAGKVHYLEGGEGRLLRLEQGDQPIHPRVGHPRHAGVHLPARGAERGGGDAGAGQQVEQRRLAALGEPDQPDLHEAPCYHTVTGRPGGAPAPTILPCSPGNSFRSRLAPAGARRSTTSPRQAFARRSAAGTSDATLEPVVTVVDRDFAGG